MVTQQYAKKNKNSCQSSNYCQLQKNPELFADYFPLTFLCFCSNM